MQHIPFAVNQPVKRVPGSLDIVKLPQRYFYNRSIPFLDFPASQGFVLHSVGVIHGVQNAYNPPRDNHEIVMLLQEWGFLVLLEEVHQMCDATFDRRNYIIPRPEGSALITTECLPALLIKWELKRRSQMSQERNIIQTNVEKLHIYIEAVTQHLKQIFPFQEDGVDKPREDPIVEAEQPTMRVGLSVLLLLEALHGLVSRHLRDAGEPSRRGPTVGQISFLRRRLDEAGWCPREITSLEQASGTGAGYMLLASSIDRNQPPRHHANHPDIPGTCQCEIFDASDSNGRGREVHSAECRDGCHTKMTLDQWNAVTAEIAALVEKDIRPILAVIEDSAGHLSVEVRPQMMGGIKIPYVAISHVWSDGLGLRDGQYLASCQLIRVQKLVDDLAIDYGFADRKPYPFWIDSICVPTHDQILRRRALLDMADVYHSALFVLMLDQGVYNVNFSGERPEASWLRVAFSKWMSRGWTFEEGGLAQNIVFRFKDRFLSLKVLYDKYFEAKRQRISSMGLDLLAGIPDVDLQIQKHNLCAADPFVQPSATEIEQFWKWYDKPWLKGLPNDRALSLRRLYNHLSRRVLTRATDECFIVAALLDIPIKRNSIAQSPDLRTVLAQAQYLPCVPYELLFHEGPRFEETGSRWIPKSIFRSATLTQPLRDIRVSGNQEATVSTRGISVSLPGLRFSMPPASSSSAPTTNDIRLVCVYVGGEYFLLAFDGMAMTSDWNQLIRREDLGVIYLPSDKRRAALVSIIEDTPSVLYVHFETVIKIHLLRELSASSTTVQGRYVDGYEWCVG